jgi:hypothetical protein
MTIDGPLGDVALGEFEVIVSAAPTASSTVFEMKLGSAWVDVSADVRARPAPRWRRGFNGSAPTDRVAGTGTLSLVLDNSAGNSGGLLGYYSPDNANLRSGFGVGTRIRVTMTDSLSTLYYRFHGRIIAIDPEAGQYKGRGVSIQAVDYMDHMANTNLERLAVQIAERPDEVITTIVSSLPIAPLSTNYATGLETLAYALHVDRDEKTTAMNAAQKTMQSDLGYLFVSGDTLTGEVLSYQNRYTRIFNTTVGATLSDTMTGLSVRRRSDRIYNDVRVSTHPVRIDAAATTVLATAQQEFNVGAGQTITITLRYRDPSGGSNRVSGTAMVSPVDGTDYEFTATAASGSNDLTGQVTNTAYFGSNSAEMAITNNAAVTAYSGGAEIYQVRGKGIYPYDPVESISQDATSQATYGTRTLNFNMPYQSNINTGIAFSAELLRRYKDPTSDVEAVTFVANRSTAFFDYAVQLDIGDRVSITETVTGISSEFFINAVELEYRTSTAIFCTWLLEPTQNAGNVGLWGTDASDSGVWGTDETDSTDWVF